MGVAFSCNRSKHFMNHITYSFGLGLCTKPLMISIKMSKVPGFITYFYHVYWCFLVVTWKLMSSCKFDYINVQGTKNIAQKSLKIERILILHFGKLKIQFLINKRPKYLTDSDHKIKISSINYQKEQINQRCRQVFFF